MAGDWRSVLEDGAVTYAHRHQDVEGAKAALGMASTMGSALATLISSNDRAQFVFPTVVVRPDGQTAGVLAVLGDRMVVGWVRGVFRPKTSTEVVRLSDISDVTWGQGTTSSTDRAQVMTVTHRGGKAVFGLPRQRTAAVAEDLTAVLRGQPLPALSA